MLHYVIGNGFGISSIPAVTSDLALWFSLDRKKIFHIGAGVTTVFPSDFSFSEVPVVGWAGLKAAL